MRNQGKGNIVLWTAKIQGSGTVFLSVCLSVFLGGLLFVVRMDGWLDDLKLLRLHCAGGAHVGGGGRGLYRLLGPIAHHGAARRLARRQRCESLLGPLRQGCEWSIHLVGHNCNIRLWVNHRDVHGGPYKALGNQKALGVLYSKDENDQYGFKVGQQTTWPLLVTSTNTQARFDRWSVATRPLSRDNSFTSH